MFDIRFTEGALEDLQAFSEFEQRWIVSALDSALTDAAQETGNRKRLNPNGLVEWVMRIGKIRVFYDIDYGNSTVKIECIGRFLYAKVRSIRKQNLDTGARWKTAQKDADPLGEENDKSRRTALNDFGEEIELTRATGPLITLLTERAEQPSVLSLPELKKRLGIAE